MEAELDKNKPKPIVRFLHFLNDRTLIVLTILIALINAPIYYYRINFPVDSDFSSYLLFTRYLIHGNINQLPVINLAHPGVEFLLAGLYYLSLHKVNLGVLLTGVMTLSQVMTAVIIYIWLGPGNKSHWNTARAFIAGTLTLAAPVMLLAFQDKLYYFGYIALVNYHNPSTILLRPLALLSFLIALRAFTETKNSWELIVASSILVVISALIKPNYLICILPALIILAVWWRILNKAVDYRFLVFGFLIPSILVLGIQWWVAYLSPSGVASHIIINPLGVERAFSGDLLPKFLLSVLFPLSILIADFRKIRDNPDLLLALIGFIFSALQLYLLAESGKRFYDGNFRWGAQVMLFVWFVISAKEYLRIIFIGSKNKGAKIILSVILLSQLAAGIAYYIHCFLSKSYA